ncbi:MAG: prepilin peptidase, partial [Pseudomonadales bacterium]
ALELLEKNSAEKAPPAEAFNLMRPRSFCPACKVGIKARHLAPILSYLFLRGKCASCGKQISPRYPLVEILAGLTTLLIVWIFGLTVTGMLACLLTWALICLALIDHDSQMLPTSITLPLLWLGLLANLFGIFASIEAAVAGAMFGYLTLWGVAHAFKLVTGKVGMGHGDFHLLAALGAWLGWQFLPQIILVSSLMGAVAGGVALLRYRESRYYPFGPYLAIAGWVALVWGKEINQLYMSYTSWPMS